ncbi:hypothetical protein RMATCC62417_14446 [Rhizopus microsporus]|nr:hypothetical protein RMATCC62417_14446 [Rhizopus microsporus]
MDYDSYFAAQRPALTKEHMKKRLRWVQEHVNWTDEQWSGVIWSDESRFTVTGNDGGARVIRKVGEQYDAKHIVPTKKYRGGGVIIWSCFHANGFGPLVLVDGTVDQDKCINILAQNLHPGSHSSARKRAETSCSKRMEPASTTGGYARWWKETHQIRGFEYWPAQSLDLNPIEHVCAALGNLIKERRSEIRNTEELSVVLREEWEKISPGLAACLVGSMKARCEAVIAAKGGSTKY